MSYPIETIAALIGAEHIGHREGMVEWLLTDSRSLCFPEETLFFALVSKRGDGHHYITELYERGVRQFVVSVRPDDVMLHACPEAGFLVVENTLDALQLLGEKHRKAFDIPVVGITGSNGKTIVKEWLSQLLAHTLNVARSPRSYNSQVGVPLSVWQINGHTQVALIEAGISEPEEMQRLQQIVNPTIGILTNIGGAHQENFSSLEEKCIEKLALFRNSDVIIYDGDDALIASAVEKTLPSMQKMAWSRTDTDKPLYISSVKSEAKSSTITYCYQGTEDSYTLPFADEASIENSIHCLAVCLCLQLPSQVIAQHMARLEPVAMRLEVKEGKNGCTLINDSYNSDIASLDIALDFMARRPEREGLERVLILSDLQQTGLPAPTLYAKVAELVESRGIERIIGIGPQLVDNAALFSIKKSFYTDTASFVQSAEISLLRKALILVKGSRSYGFDQIAEQLTLKVHETILDINLGALIDNLNYYRGQLSPSTKMVCMVKAFAYGSGFYEIAKTLQDHRVDYLAVAVADEGEQLRKAGITANILVMNPEMTAFKTLFDNHLEPEIYSFALLEAMIHACEREGYTHYPVHIKIDTGMSRLGFRPDELPQLIERLQKQHAVLPRSVFSHFAGSDSCDLDAFTHLQAARFADAAHQLQASFSHKILCHICNSAGIERFPEYHHDMVRLGLGLYGISPVDNRLLHPVSSLRTTILQIHDVPETETVGYSRRGQLIRPSRIASLPIGYADGLNRRLGNRVGYCIVNGCKAPYVGNICMDVCMIDVTDIDCHEGDSVEIFGPSLPVTQVAEWLGTIPYEVMTGISTRVKRVYSLEN
ncbi:MAG: bifunctional UDP-N-acetylmuramoyl-tripeptide:D-alanyl-D-alanine ligase/alanine racemase [Bacteroidaceae bacterium]|nr:bifunctional UDP-N-acetylmuramoyl-tripeptide:D-alanyl-D-alanine ligase/alanine racemase [Bacteroidaceae bacterium]